MCHVYFNRNDWRCHRESLWLRIVIIEKKQYIYNIVKYSLCFYIYRAYCRDDDNTQYRTIIAIACAISRQEVFFQIIVIVTCNSQVHENLFRSIAIDCFIAGHAMFREKRPRFAMNANYAFQIWNVNCDNCATPLIMKAFFTLLIENFYKLSHWCNQICTAFIEASRNILLYSIAFFFFFLCDSVE